MKKAQVVLNVVLIIAVIVLFFLYFSCGKKECLASSGAECSTGKDSGGYKKPRIAYVELDSVNNGVTFIRDRRAELESEQKDMENDYDNAYRQLGDEKTTFLKRGAAITEPEAEAFQQKLIQQQQQIEEDKQARSQQLAEKSSQIMEGIQKSLKDFITDYNKDKKYTYILTVGTGFDYMLYKDSTLNITSDVVKGLNDKMNNPK
jgi:outer membrane protein